MPAMVRTRRRISRRLRRSRGPRPAIVVALVVALAVVVSLAMGIAHQVDRQSLPYRRSVDRGFATILGPLGVESAATGAQLAATLQGAAGSDRVGLLTALSIDAATAARTAAVATAADPPVPSAPLAGDCQLALQDRAVAVATVHRAVSALLGGPTGTSAGAGQAAAAARAMSDAASEVVASDARWTACRSSMRRAPGLARLPASSWAGHGVWSAGSASAMTATLVSAPSLAAAPALVVEAVTTTPPAVGSTGSPPQYTVPATAALGVRVIVDNTGNVSLPGVAVRVVVAPSAGGRGASGRATVSLGPGESTAVTVAHLHVTPGSSNTVTATATASSSGQVAATPVSVDVAVVQGASVATVTPSVNPTAVGHPVTYTAAVTASLAGSTTPSGTVAFEDGGAPIAGCTAQPLRAGVATCVVRYPAAGAHAITATYAGTATVGGTTSNTITETVTAPPARHGSSRSAGHP